MTIHRWLVKSAWPGMGLFGESYMLFSVGTLTPLWKELYPDCFDNQEVCKPRLLHSLTYSVVTGVIVGMLALGYAANKIGRRKGSLLTASLMSGGALAMVLVSIIWSSQDSVVFLYRGMAVSLFFFGIGVGGEYPLAASLASERAMEELIEKQNIVGERLKPTSSRLDNSPSTDKAAPLMRQENRCQQRRGRQIQLVFTMQGMGIWFNSLTLMFLLWVTGQTSAEKYEPTALLAIWRITYLIGAGVLSAVLVTRYIYLEESQVWAQDKKEREEQEQLHEKESCAKAVAHDQESTHIPCIDAASKPETQYQKEFSRPALVSRCSTVSELSMPTVMVFQEEYYYNNQMFHNSLDNSGDLRVSHLRLLLQNFGGRLFGASMSWLLWDISFYGNKLFQSTFLLAITGEETTLLEFAAAATLNATVALLGYFGAALLVERPELGRVKLQSFGLMITGSLFVMCGFFFESLPSAWLVGLYLASSFFGQLGPNATTFLVPAEIFPTEQRTYCHGICAASGKVGALFAAVVFNFIPDDVDLFLLSGYASFLACFITYYFIPETTGLDLLEMDIKWRLILEGRQQDYHGPANYPDFLSLHERRNRGETHIDVSNQASVWMM